MAEPSELMQLEMSEDIRLGSPDDASNILEPEFNLLGTTSQTGNPIQHRADLYRTESIRKWPPSSLQDPLSTTGLQVQPPPQLSGPPLLDELTQENTHYSQTVSTILQHQALRWPETSSSGYALYSTQSAFAKWTARCEHYLQVPSLAEENSQWLLKYILFSVPFLHNKYRDENSPKLRDNEASGSRFRKSTPQDELSANHVLAERRRREKLNERFIILRSLVPFVTKMDKASILGDTIEYVKQLRRKIQDLETRIRQMEVEQQRLKSVEPPQRTSSGSKEQRSGLTGIPERTWSGSGSERRKIRAVEGSSAAKPVTKVVEPPVPAVGEALQVQVSIIETDALVELQCPYREGLLLDVMVTLREHRIETTTVQSSLTNGAFVAELRAKVKENVNGKKVTIAEVKRAIYQIIPQC